IHGRLSSCKSRTCVIVTIGNRVVRTVIHKLKIFLRSLPVLICKIRLTPVYLPAEVRRSQVYGNRVPGSQTGPGVTEAEIEGQDSLTLNFLAQAHQLIPG